MKSGITLARKQRPKIDISNLPNFDAYIKLPDMKRKLNHLISPKEKPTCQPLGRLGRASTQLKYTNNVKFTDVHKVR